MRHLSRFERSLAGCTPLILTLAPYAHAAPGQSERIRVTVPVKVGDLKTKDERNLTAVGEKFRLWLSVNASDCNDPALLGNGGKDDHAFELYGELRVNGNVEWKVSSNTNGAGLPLLRHLDLPSSAQVDPRTQGFSLNSDPSVFMDKHEIKVDTSQNRFARISLQLFDKDDPQRGFDFDTREARPADRKPDKIGDYKIDLDLSKLGKSNGRYYWFWNSKDESGNPIGTNLYLYVEHAGTTYASTPSGPSKPYIDPRITEKKFPRRVPLPGPVITRPVRR